ncbi:MAG: tandem-95 repeat protein [Chitinophagaceae bacterium]|nr:tandem-95 repeat protein [Chitinophagaceae bacterium]
MSTIIQTIRQFLVISCCMLFSVTQSAAQTETISTGSFIINMGATTPNTIANGIKPYGLVYDLVRNYSVPVRWVISQTKIKDGPDFTYNGVQYKGGTFIIPAEYRTTAVNSRITYWTGIGVVGATTNSPLTVDVTYIIKAPPRWTLDVQNGAIAEGYLINAGITNAAFPGAYNWKSPQTLGSCDDFFVMPHAEPTWATHSNLLAWNRDYFGSIWSACHAVSALENMVNPGNTTQQTNFLTVKDASFTTPLVSSVYANSNSLLLWTAHSDATAPFTTRLPNDPVAQFLGLPDAALLNGSEKIYIPRQTGGVARWNPGVKMITYDPSQTNVSSPAVDLSNVAALIVYGRAFDDPSRGYVMYEAGHSMNKGSAGDVAGQRAFFNFSFFQVTPKAPILSGTGPAAGVQVSNGDVLTYTISASSPMPGITFTYLWTASCAGTFSNPTGTSTTFTPAGTAGVAVVTCTVTDNCGRNSFQSYPVTILPPPVSPTVANDNANISGSCPPGTPVSIDVMANDIPNTSTISFTSLNQGAASPANAGVWSATGAGVVTFTPDANFNGTATITYTVTNTQGLTSNATINVTVGDIDANGCTPNSIYGPADVSNITLAGYISSTGVTTAQLNGTQLDDNENTFSSTGTSGDYLDFGTAVSNNLILAVGSASPLRAKDSLHISWKKNQNTSTGTFSVQIGTSAVGPWTNTQVFSSNSNPSVTVLSKYAIPSGVTGITHIKISAGNVTSSTASATQVYIDAVEYEYLSCIPKNPSSINDIVTVLEDQPAVINVLNNDADPQGLALTIRHITSPPVKGVVSINADGTITYVSNTDISGVDNFSYDVINTEGYLDTANVQVTINDDGCSAGQYKAALSGGATTKVFQYQFAGTNAASGNSTAAKFRDSYIRSGSTNNYGSNSTFYCGIRSSATRRPVYFFDLTEIPSTAVVQSALFSATTSATATNTKTISVHALTRAFNETQTTWTLAQTGTNWTTAGGDFNGTAASTMSVGTTSGLTVSWDISSLAQSWVTSSGTNYGILQKPTDEALTTYHTFAAREYTTNTAYRPKLTVTYLEPVACAAIPNRAPLANPDFAATESGVAVMISPLANDADVDAANTKTVTGVIQGANGNATFTGTTVTYTPNTTGGVPRTDRISYIISDNGTGTLKDTAYIYINVDNAQPNVVKDLATTNSGTMVSVTVKTNDTDPENTTLGAPVITENPRNGSAVVSGNNIQYTPGAGFTGTDTLVYQLCESAASSCSSTPLCDTALLVITVTNQSPTAGADSKTGLPCQDLRIDLAANDSDPESGVLTVTNISALSNPVAGTLVNNNDGTVTFTPAMGYTGTVTFTYKMTDDGNSPLSSSNATVSITIANAANSAPVAVDDAADASNQDETVYYSVLDNDSDPDGNTLDIPTITVQPLHGTATVLPNGLIQYVPDAGYFGKDTLTYQVCDYVLNPATCAGGSGLCATAKLTFNVHSTGITISGNIWNDKNGDISENGLESNPSGTTLYITLADQSGNVIQSVPIAGDGSYSFTQITPGNTYTLVLSTTQGTNGQPAPAATLPAGWVNTGTSLLGGTFSSTPGVIGPLVFGYSDALDFKFGIEQLPSTDGKTANITQPAVNTYLTLNGGANLPVFTGTDPEDCNSGCDLSAKSVYFTTVPANAQLYYNGALVSAGQQIDNFDPDLLQLKIINATLGTTGISFQYAYVDAAGFKDPTPATYSVTWLNPLPVTGLFLTGSLQNDMSKLVWKTETETNTIRFEVERSTDNIRFSAVGQLPAAGNSITSRSYTYSDDISTLYQYPAVYYRIRQLDVNGHSTVSNIIVVKPGIKTGINVWPNPFDGNISVSIQSNDAYEGKIKIAALNGQLLRTYTQTLKKGTTQFNLVNLGNLPAGVYILRVEDESGTIRGFERVVRK